MCNLHTFACILHTLACILHISPNTAGAYTHFSVLYNNKTLPNQPSYGSAGRGPSANAGINRQKSIVGLPGAAFVAEGAQRRIDERIGTAQPEAKTHNRLSTFDF